jgi:hypothetical protein
VAEGVTDIVIDGDEVSDSDVVTDPVLEDDMELEDISERVIEGVSDPEGVMLSEELVE